VFQHPAGAQPEVIVVVRHFSGGLVGQGEDFCLAVGLAIKFHAFAGLDVGVIPFAEAPERFLAINHRPAQAA